MKKYTNEVKAFIINNSDKGYTWLLEKLNNVFKINTTHSSLKSFCRDEKIKIKDIRTPRKYTKEMQEFMKENSHKGSKWITEKLRSEFGIKVSQVQVQDYCSEHNIKLTKIIWDYEIRDYLAKHHNDFTFAEMVKELKEKFNFDIKIESLYAYYHRFDYKPSSIPMPPRRKSKYKVGDTINYGRKIFIKYRDLPVLDGQKDIKVNCMIKLRYVWLQHNKDLSDDYAIISLDGDRNSEDINNLRAVPKKIVPRLTKWCGNGIITDAMIEICMLEEDLRRLENGSN